MKWIFGEAIDRNLRIHGILLDPSPGGLTALATAVEDGLRPSVRGVYPLNAARTAHERIEAGGIGGKLALVMS